MFVDIHIRRSGINGIRTLVLSPPNFGVFAELQNDSKTVTPEQESL